jgi:hypothetical protein
MASPRIDYWNSDLYYAKSCIHGIYIMPY